MTNESDILRSLGIFLVAKGVAGASWGARVSQARGTEITPLTPVRPFLLLGIVEGGRMLPVDIATNDTMVIRYQPFVTCVGKSTLNTNAVKYWEPDVLAGEVQDALMADLFTVNNHTTDPDNPAFVDKRFIRDPEVFTEVYHTVADKFGLNARELNFFIDVYQPRV